MGDVNLIPAARLARKRLRKRLRLWAIIGTTYALLLATGSLAARVLCPGENHSLDEQLAEATQQIKQADLQMLELDRELAIPPRPGRQPRRSASSRTGAGCWLGCRTRWATKWF